MQTSTAGIAASKARGFSYTMVLAAIVIVGIIVEAAHLSTWRVLQADREAELLFRGLAYRRAIESFYQSNGRYPRTLEDLLKDPGSAARRHIRALYPDPMVRGDKKEWLLVRGKDGGIAGVASSSQDEPLKRANFPQGLEKFAGAASYKEWVFEYIPAPAPTRGAASHPIPPAGPPAIRTF